MSLHQIRVKSVNVHRSNARTHSMLENGSEFEILLIQEPWFDVVATLHSDTDPTGVSQLGVAMHPEWDAHLPKHRNGQICKAIAYSKKSLVCSHIIDNVLNHPLANPNSIILDVKEDSDIIARLVNTYHAVPHNGHMLEHQYAPHLSEEHSYLQGVRGSVSQTRACPVSFVILLSFIYRR
jgi:hypothetical protein